MKDILKKIALDKRIEIERLKKLHPLDVIKKEIDLKEGLDFAGALTVNTAPNIVAELKKGSPSKGVMVSDFNPIKLAESYRDGGAAVLSVLTEEEHFYGRHEYMKMAKTATGLPILCKDFFIDEYQIYRAKAGGADAILLITSLLTKKQISEFIKIADKLKMVCLVETHNENEIEIALSAGAKIVGVNNRNLSDFSVDLARCEQLAKLIPDNIIKVAESGIFKREHIVRLEKAGYSNFLIGEALVTAADPTGLIKSLRGSHDF